MENKQPETEIELEQQKKDIPIPLIPIKWHVPNNIVTRFTTNLIIQVGEGAFKILFFEVQPEIYLEGQPVPKEMTAECVASIVVTPEVLAKFTEVFQKQLNLYNEKPESKE